MKWGRKARVASLAAAAAAAAPAFFFLLRYHAAASRASKRNPPARTRTWGAGRAVTHYLLRVVCAAVMLRLKTERWSQRLEQQGADILRGG